MVLHTFFPFELPTVHAYIIKVPRVDRYVHFSGPIFVCKID